MVYLPNVERAAAARVINPCLPAENSYIIPLTLPFTATQQLLTVPLVQLLQSQKMSGIQGIYVYNPSTLPVLIGVPESKQNIPIPAGYAGYIAVLVPNDAVITFSSAVTVDTYIQVQLLNFPVQTQVWAIAGASGVVPATPVYVVQLGTLATDRSGTIALAGTSQPAMAANTTRAEAWVSNPDALAESLWINPTGGVALANGAGSIEIPPGTGWAGQVTNQINVVAATLGHKYTAGER